MSTAVERTRDHMQSMQAAFTPEPDFEFDFEEIWADVRARIDQARHEIPDPPSFRTFDDLGGAISHLRALLAHTPLDLRAPAAVRTDAPARHPATNSDQHLAAVDDAYTRARSIGIPATDPAYHAIRALHTAAHTLWASAKAAAGTYWAQLLNDARIHGVVTTLTARAAQVITHLATAAAERLDAHTARQPTLEHRALRLAYINARSQIRAHAASHEWQRIAALWGTVNTLARHADDPSIRAVAARSADTISDHAKALARKTAPDGKASELSDVLAAFALAAQQHAAALRDGPRTEQSPEHTYPRPVTTTIVPTVTAPLPERAMDAHELQTKARLVAKHAQARLAHHEQRLHRAKIAAATRRPIKPDACGASLPAGVLSRKRSTTPAVGRAADDTSGL